MIRYAALQYRIATYPDGSWETVNGYAMQLPRPFHWLRCCVREATAGYWRIDHYDSGMSVGGPVVGIGASSRRLAYVRRWHTRTESREAAVRWLVRYLRHLLRSKPEHIAVLRAAQGQ